MVELIAIPLKNLLDDNLISSLRNFLKSSSEKDHSEEMNEFSHLRSNALRRAYEKCESSLEVIYNYYDQLCSLEEKIPVHVILIHFQWKDAFVPTISRGESCSKISTLTYEKMCVLFNIAALQSSVAASQSMETAEGLELSEKLFQQSSAIFKYLELAVMSSTQQEYTPDMSPDTLNALVFLMLSQAQEIFVHEAIHKSMEDSLIAALANCVDDMYGHQRFQKHMFWAKDWISLISAKQSGYRAMAQLFHSSVCRTKNLIGEEISRLEYAVKLFKTAAEISKKPNLFEEYSGRAQRRLTGAKKDNDCLHHEPVPDIKTLKGIRLVKTDLLAKVLPVNHPMSSNFRDIFEKTLPGRRKDSKRARR